MKGFVLFPVQVHDVFSNLVVFFVVFLIKNDEEKMFVVIENRIISIINHIYSYTIYCEDQDSFEEMLKDFDTQLENKRIEIEKEIKANIRHSLKNILSSMNQQ